MAPAVSGGPAGPRFRYRAAPRPRPAEGRRARTKAWRGRTSRVSLPPLSAATSASAGGMAGSGGRGSASAFGAGDRGAPCSAALLISADIRFRCPARPVQQHGDPSCAILDRCRPQGQIGKSARLPDKAEVRHRLRRPAPSRSGPLAARGQSQEGTSEPGAPRRKRAFQQAEAGAGSEGPDGKTVKRHLPPGISGLPGAGSGVSRLRQPGRSWAGRPRSGGHPADRGPCRDADRRAPCRFRDAPDMSFQVPAPMAGAPEVPAAVSQPRNSAAACGIFRAEVAK